MKKLIVVNQITKLSLDRLLAKGYIVMIKGKESKR